MLANVTSPAGGGALAQRPTTTSLVLVARGQRVFGEAAFVDCRCGKSIVRFARPRAALAAAGVGAAALSGLTVEDVSDTALSSSAWEARE